ncbi:MAG: L-rhamnose/proton symporter RhaT [Bacteroidales bacterium]|nr:L-rhamnose/proton symporter RhaT [Bacteroidales bacterium]
MNTIFGLLIIALGSMGQSSSYVPIKKVKTWSWETFWLMQGVFAWLVFPFLGALLAVPEGSSLCSILSVDSAAALKAIFYGVLWGVGGLTFGLSMRYLGVALGQSIALGTCSAFGTLIPAIFFDKQDLFHGSGLILLLGVCITLAGIAVIGYAGGLRSKNMTEEQKKAAVKDFALTKGLLVALLAGLMSACFALGLSAGQPIAEAAKVLGASDLFATLPATLMVTMGGFLTNAIYCLFQNFKNKTFKDYTSVSGKVWFNNILFCALAGILWYSQFFGLAMGKSFLTDSPLMLAFSWSILMALNVSFSNVWGILLKEWKGVSKQTITVLFCGILILIFSVFFPNMF